MLVGQKGVKYGLHVRQPKQQEQQKPATGRLAAFSADSDSEEDVGAQVARQAARKVADSKVQEMYAAALAEDPNAFDYDGVYDSIQQEKAAPKAQDKVARQPKYIANLLEQAQLRKREQDITNERRLLKERQKEDHEYGDSEKFITSAYRKKLEEDKKWQESQALKDLDDERNDVTKLGHMNNFFHNLTRNVALGGPRATIYQFVIMREV
ncbi:hypothetical protein OEZ86_011094 [Tetradesmus obliquus]|nr:hypothetical protein OEZ86_011094 [Tetradesmus obliquus]